jgi:hypothetical protein
MGKPIVEPMLRIVRNTLYSASVQIADLQGIPKMYSAVEEERR